MSSPTEPQISIPVCRSSPQANIRPDVTALCKAIKTIPGKGIAPFEKFLFHTLVSCMGVQNRLGNMPVGLNMDMWKKLGAREASAKEGEAIVEATRAYMTVVAEAAPFTDVLCEVHAHLLARGDGDGLGQYFTPWDLADLTAVLARDHFVHHPLKLKPGEPFAIHEPACGAGGLVLAQLRDLPAGVSSREVAIEAIDLDPTCCAMTTLQLVANSLLHGKLFQRVRIWCGNTLLPPEELQLFAALKREPDGQDRDQAWEQVMRKCGIRN